MEMTRPSSIFERNTQAGNSIRNLIGLKIKILGIDPILTLLYPGNSKSYTKYNGIIPDRIMTKEFNGKNCLQIRQKKLSFWVLAPFGSL